ncbi:related to Vacuolar protein sorting-associated protein 54 [Saccharomycodes ludwigii]|uniref:Related to Vacuolar protein sorting-associated protein 54 n=1 Tax=Saccharomycodes ludwigii TaxID=36035 RepID=A0A376B9B8_9ASCO|nr:hypothetical protein SCDLUD_003603 [Saccharomycodes ludwigii]KAH3900611.1 hypothetical protein SCDLUD_003603 [Saccharomycodes ludwigii]SSD61247.1 related to Vacuolar protein sorting-associated protein 54 [Saccharomycodes ludwigii]
MPEVVITNDDETISLNKNIDKSDSLTIDDSFQSNSTANHNHYQEIGGGSGTNKRTDLDSLNDDLLSVHGNGLASPVFLKPSSISNFNGRSPSIDSMSRRSFDTSSLFTPRGSIDNMRTSFTFGSPERGNDNGNNSTAKKMFLLKQQLKQHSGSVVYSPLGNNSIYEVVMNTRRKNWLRPATVEDIPPVRLSKEAFLHDSSNWKPLLKEYLNLISNDYNRFSSLINHKDDAVNDKNMDIIEGDAEDVIDKIPDIFFDKNFKLDNQRILNRICNFKFDSNYEEQLCTVGSQLNEYLDIVENRLIAEINDHSHQFFKVLEDVSDVKKDVISLKADFVALSNNLQKMKQDKIDFKIGNLEKQIKYTNVAKLEHGLLKVRETLNMIESLQLEYNKDDSNTNLHNCLDKIDEIETYIKSSGLNIGKLPGLSKSRELLSAMRIEIGGKYSVKFCNLLMKDLDQFSEKIARENGENSQFLVKNLTKQSNFNEFDDDLKNNIKDIVKQLNRCEELTTSYQLYQDKILNKVKDCIKSELYAASKKQEDETNSINNNDTQPPKLSVLIRDQTPNEFQQMLETIFANAFKCFTRLYGQQKLLLDIGINETFNYAANCSNKNGSVEQENQHNMIMQLDIRNGISESIRIVQLRMAKIITVRRDLNLKLRFDHFLKLYNIIALFIKQCETLSGDVLTSNLNDVLNQQASNYCNYLPTYYIKHIQLKINKENWVPFIVTPETQTDVNDIVSSADINPLHWLDYGKLGNEPKEYEQTQQDDNNNGHKKSVVVHDKTFVASSSLLETLEYIKSALILSLNLPSKNLHLLEKACIDLLKFYNSHTVASITTKDPNSGELHLKFGKNFSILAESLECLKEIVIILKKTFQRLNDEKKTGTSTHTNHFSMLPSKVYNDLIDQYEKSSQLILHSNIPPPLE